MRRYSGRELDEIMGRNFDCLEQEHSQGLARDDIHQRMDGRSTKWVDVNNGSRNRNPCIFVPHFQGAVVSALVESAVVFPVLIVSVLTLVLFLK